MPISIKTTNLEITPSLNSYIEKKIGSLIKFLKQYDSSVIETTVEIGKPSQHHKHGNVYYAEVNINLPGQFIRANINAADVYSAIDGVRDELQRQIKENKEKTITRNRRKERSFKKARALSPYSRFRQK